MSQEAPAPSRIVQVPWERLAGWFERYDARHPGTSWLIDPLPGEPADGADGAGDAAPGGGDSCLLRGSSPEGARVELDVPFPPLRPPTQAGLVAHMGRPWRLGFVLVRRGGFAVAAVEGADLLQSKVGQRHVQGRSKAGGWSQQRFARRRDNQAKAAYQAAADHTCRILAPLARRLDMVVTGGDRQAVDAVLVDPRLAELASRPRRWMPGVADPRRATLIGAIERFRSVEVRVWDPPTGGQPRPE